MTIHSSVLLGASPTTTATARVAPDVVRAWRWVTWFSLVLTMAGLADWLLVWLPVRFGSPEWEFGTIVASISGLPLITMGFAGLLGSAVARGIRWQIVVVATLLLIWTACILASLALFLLDVPIALRSVSGVAHIGIVKATTKTLFLGTLFSTAYLVAGLGALRQLRDRGSASGR